MADMLVEMITPKHRHSPDGDIDKNHKSSQFLLAGQCACYCHIFNTSLSPNPSPTTLNSLPSYVPGPSTISPVGQSLPALTEPVMKPAHLRDFYQSEYHFYNKCANQGL